jgi:hypothetical protein
MYTLPEKWEEGRKREYRYSVQSSMFIDPLFVFPLAKGEIEWGFWIPALVGMTTEGLPVRCLKF